MVVVCGREEEEQVLSHKETFEGVKIFERGAKEGVS